MERHSFLDQEPPPGYIAGIGRGATGFSTQADFSLSSRKPSENTTGQENGSLDSIIGFKSNDDDKEADQIYNEVESYLRNKRNKKRKTESKSVSDNKVVAEEESVSQSITKISDHFQDVKQELSTVSNEQWENLPESGDFTRRNKRLREELQSQQRFYRNSDMAAIELKDSGTTDLVLDNFNTEMENENETGPDQKSESNVNLFELSRTKDRLLENQIKLGYQNMKSEVNTSEYLQSLNPKGMGYNIGDYKKTRKLLAKLRETNPNNPQNWIASAKLEYDAQKYRKARSIIQEGCEKCLKSEEIWLTNLEMNEDNIPICKVIVADAIKYNYKSIKLWMKAVGYEKEKISKSRIIRKALEWLPKSEELWIAASDYEQELLIRIQMLQKAVSLLPESLNLWLKLASLQDNKNAMQTLGEAVDKVSRDQAYLLWVKLAQLEEKNNGNELKINKFVGDAIASFNCGTFDKWIHEAEKCETSGYKLTCRAIILISIGNERDLQTLLKYCNSACDSNYFEVSDSIYTYLTTAFPQDDEIWREYLSFKKNIKDFPGLFMTYELAISFAPQNSELYVHYCDDKLIYDFDIEKIRMILSEALEKLPKDEKLWLYSISFEFKNGFITTALDLFDSCLNNIETPTVNFWLAKIEFERRLSDVDSAMQTVNRSITLYPSMYRFYIEKSELHDLMKAEDDVKVTLEIGIKSCANNESLYIALSKFYFKRHGNIIKARSILDEGLSKHPGSDILHHARIKLELNTENKAQAERLLSRALTLNPSSTTLWCDNIKLASKQQKKNIYAHALSKTKDNPVIILTIAKDLWKSGKIEKANQFFKVCMEKDPKYGDFYIFYYAFLLAYGGRDDMKNLEQQVLENSPFHGHKWNTILKKSISRNVPDLQLVRETAVDVTNLM